MVGRIDPLEDEGIVQRLLMLGLCSEIGKCIAEGLIARAQIRPATDTRTATAERGAAGANDGV